MREREIEREIERERERVWDGGESVRLRVKEKLVYNNIIET